MSLEYNTTCNYLKNLQDEFIFGVPIWSPNEGVGRTGDGGRAKICQFHLPWLSEQDVSCLDVSVKKHIRRGLQHRTGRARKHSTTCSDLDKHPPVNHLVGMKVSQPLKSTVGNCSYFHLLQRLLVNCRGPSQTQRCQSCVRWWWGSTWKGKGVTVRALNLPSNKSDAEPRQYSITSWNKMKQIFVWMDCLLFLITSCGCSNVRSYPGSVLPQETSFVLNAVGVLYSLQEFHLLDDVLPLLRKKNLRGLLASRKINIRE